MATILLVVGNAGSLTLADTAVQGRLTAAGHTVTVIDDDTAEPDSGTYDGVAACDSSSGGSVLYGSVAKPGLTTEQPTSWNLGSNIASTAGVTQWSVNSVSPQNGGLTGTQTVYESPGLGQQGLTPGGTHTVIATQQGDAGKPVYVIWESGAPLASGNAPAKRCFIRIPNYNSSEFLATAGVTLLDAAIDWTFGDLDGTPVTFGKTTNGASASTSSATRVWVSQATPASTGVVATGHARLSLNAAGSTSVKFAIYADSSGEPGALLAESGTITLDSTTEAERVFTFSGGNLITVNSGTPYWIGPSWQDPDPGGATVSVSISRDNTATQRREQSLTWPTLPNPFGTALASATGPIDAYVTYTVDGDAQPEPGRMLLALP